VAKKRTGQSLKDLLKQGREIGSKASKPQNIQTSKNSNVQTSRSPDIKKSRRPTTMYLTKEQFRAIKEIQLQLLDDDFKLENSQIAGLGIEILKELFKNSDVQKSKSLETLKSRCLDILRRPQNT